MYVFMLLISNLLKSFPVTVLLFSVIISLCEAREYHKEVYLQFPNRIAGCDVKEIQPPGTIVLDNQDRLCYREGARIAVYNFMGEIIDEIYLRGESGAVLGVLDFCFDEEGNFYTLENRTTYPKPKRNPVDIFSICKFNTEGTLIGKMEKRNGDQRRFYPGRRITYIPDYGIVISSYGIEHLPVRFDPDRPLEFIYYDNKINRMMIDKDSYVESLELSDRIYRLTVYKNGAKTSTIETGGEAETYWNLIPSRDKTCQYYHCRGRDSETRERYSIIRKYDSGELIYSSDRLSGVTSGAKSCAVDSQGNIYYCSADERHVTIVRWILQ